MKEKGKTGNCFPKGRYKQAVRKRKGGQERECVVNPFSPSPLLRKI